MLRALPAAGRVFLFFSLGYFVSYIYRGVNVGFAPFLVSEMGLSAANLGMLTSLYFLGFALAQLPAGILLDSWGPRRVNAALMLLAAAGTLVFGLADGLGGLMLGRLMIGIGVAVCLGATVQALAHKFAQSRLALMNGLVMAVGGMGGVIVGAPLSWLLELTSWRTVSCGLAVLTVLVAALIWFGVDADDPPRHQRLGLRAQLAGSAALLADRTYWRMMSLPVATAGAFYSAQSLWVRPYLIDVNGLDAQRVAWLVSLLGLAMVIGNVGLGALARHVERLGLSLYGFCGVGMLAFLGVQGLILLGAPIPDPILWAAFGIFGCAHILIFAVVAGHFPRQLLGRATTTTNLLMFLAIFLCQIGIGALVNLWPEQAGRYPAVAHLTAWGVVGLIQVASAFWYFWPQKKKPPPRKEKAGSS